MLFWHVSAMYCPTGVCKPVRRNFQRADFERVAFDVAGQVGGKVECALGEPQYERRVGIVVGLEPSRYFGGEFADPLLDVGVGYEH